MLDEPLDYATYPALVGPPFRLDSPDTAPYYGGGGVFTRQGPPKPVYNAFVFLNQLAGGRRLALTSSNNPIDGLATLMPDGAVRLVLTSYDEDWAADAYETKVALTISGLGEKKYRCTRLWAADRKHGNGYAAWEAMGSPKGKAANEPEFKAKLTEANRHVELEPLALSTQGSDLTVELIMPNTAIRFMELAPSSE